MPQPRAIVPDSGAVRPCFNTSGSTHPKYRLLKKSNTAVDATVLATNGAALIYAATMAAIPDGFAGDGQVEGRALVEAGGAIGIGVEITAGSGGKAAVAAAGDYIFGVSASAAGADGEVIEVDVVRGIKHA